MKLIRKYGYEILASLLGVAFVTMLLYLVIVKPEDLYVRGTVMFGMLFDGIAIYYALRKLWRTKWRYRVVPAVQRVWEKIARVLKIVRTKLGLEKKEKRTVLKGKTIVFFEKKPLEQQATRAKKPLGWGSLQTDRERLGYLYRRMIDGNINRGLPVFSFETPSEIKEKKEYKDCENQIFDLYVANRYKGEVSLDRETLNDLKKELKNTK